MELPAISVNDLLYELDQRLISLLKRLPPATWEAQTLAPEWKVRDVAAHLLDGNLRALSMLRDGYFGVPTGEVQTHAGLVRYLNQLNADWVRAARRLSPAVLIDLLATSGKEYCDYLTGLDPMAPAVFAVGWAGEKVSPNWFHVARDYTEKWHHQQQIRVAANLPGDLLTYTFFYPYLDTSVRALPYHYREVAAPAGTTIAFVFVGEEEKIWHLIKQATGWQLAKGRGVNAACTVRLPDDLAWRIFTKGVAYEAALAQAEILGEERFGLPVFQMLAIMG